MISTLPRSYVTKIRDAALARAGYSAQIFRAPRTHRATVARGHVFALMRAHHDMDCPALTLQQIALACGQAGHTSLLYPMRLYTKLHGDVAPWSMRS